MKKIAIGIDIGGTNTKFGAADREGTVFFNDRIKTQGHNDFDSYFKELCSAIEVHLGNLSFPYELVGVGVGAPNGNYFTGNIENAPNLPWKGQIQLGKMLTEQFGVPGILTNDANAAAIGEMVYGGAKGMKDFLVVTLGTGLGSGFVANGEMINGHDGFAGELGHVIVKQNGRICGCGRKGCLETYVSATGIRRTVYKLLADDPSESVLRDISYNNLSTKMITEAAEQDDAIALKAFDYTGRILGRKLADTVAITSPEAIFIFGGLAKAKDYIFKPTIKYMEANLLQHYKGNVKILPSGLGDETAPILGASSLIWKDVKTT